MEAYISSIKDVILEKSKEGALMPVFSCFSGIALYSYETYRKGKYSGASILLNPASEGTGVIAGGPMRAVFEALGIQDIVAKSVGTSNPHNMIRATFEALKSASSPKIIAVRRNLKINDITKRRKIVNVGGENVKN